MHTGQGIDVSHYQGEINWPQVKGAGIEFAFIKATEGEQITDDRFQENWRATRDENIAHGAYHFFRADEDAKNQAEHFLATLKAAGNRASDLPPVLDIEVAGGIDKTTFIQNVTTWLETVENELGRKPCVYTNRAFWDTHMNSDFGDYPLWIADWNNSQEPELPLGWQTWAYWQVTENGKVPGIEGNVDIDRRKS